MTQSKFLIIPINPSISDIMVIKPILNSVLSDIYSLLKVNYDSFSFHSFLYAN